MSALAAALALAGCGADRDDAMVSPSTAPVAGAASTSTVDARHPQWVIQSFEFFLDVMATAGVPVEVVNLDGADHTLTDVDGSFEAYVDADDATLLTIDSPGTYAVWCRIHPDMRGTVVVEAVP